MAHKRSHFGSYCLVYIGTRNNMRHRCVTAISLRESNAFGGLYIIYLSNGKRLHSYIWEALPIENKMIERVKESSREYNQPFIPNKQPIFELAPGEIMQYPVEEQGEANEIFPDNRN